MNHFTSESPFSRFSYSEDKDNKESTIKAIRVPHFVSDLPEIDFEKATEFAFHSGMLDKAKLPRRIQEDSELCDKIAAKKMLLYCRRNKLHLPEAIELYKKERQSELSPAELFEMFLVRDEEKVAELKNSEIRRRAQRDQDILNLETDLLRQQGIQVPDFESLIEYCGWLPEFTGHNPRFRENGWQNSTDSAEDIYWDLMDHYNRIMRGAVESFNPLEDWPKVLEGGTDNPLYEEWDLQNMGEKDLSYYSIVKRHGGGARTKPHRRKEYKGRLLTHTTSLGAAQSIIRDGYLHPRVCYSVDLVISSGIDSPRVTLIFDRQEMEQMYCLMPYTEPGGGHEDEIRSNEINHVGFCIGFIPHSDSIFSGVEGGGAGTTASGRELVTAWDQRYHQEGRLWTDEEIERFRRLSL